MAGLDKVFEITFYVSLRGANGEFNSGIIRTNIPAPSREEALEKLEKYVKKKVAVTATKVKVL